MPELDVEAYRSQVFGNGQSSNHPPTPTPTTDTSSAEPILTDTAQKAETNVATKPDATDTPTTVIATEPKPIDENLLVKERLGYDNWETAKSEIEALKQKASTPAEIKFANDQSKAWYEAILAGDIDKAVEIHTTQKQIAAVDKMTAPDAIKLHIQQTNKSYKPIDVEDVFEEKYSYPDKPVQGDVEEETDFAIRSEKWKAAKEKVDRRIERDADTAKQELSKLSAELKLPEIPKPATQAQTSEDELKEIQVEKAAAAEFYSKLSPKDVEMVFKFNDEATKLAFDINYEPDADGFDVAKAEATDLTKFFDNFYGKDGSPDRVKLLMEIYAGRNIQKIVSEAIVHAVNQERIRALKFQKNIGDGTQRNYVLPPVTEIERLKQQVFGN